MKKWIFVYFKKKKKEDFCTLRMLHIVSCDTKQLQLNGHLPPIL